MILAEAWHKLVFSAELRSLPTTQIPQTFLAESIIIPFPPTLVEIQLRPEAPVKSHGHCASLRDLREMGGGKGAAAACTSPLATSVGLQDGVEGFYSFVGLLKLNSVRETGRCILSLL